MVALVTVEQVDNALRLNLEADLGDPSGDDADTSRLDNVTMRIAQATDIVLDYLKIAEEDVTWTTETVPGRVSAAIILVVESLFDDGAKGEMLKGLANGDLANPVVALLYRSRDPTLA